MQRDGAGDAPWTPQRHTGSTRTMNQRVRERADHLARALDAHSEDQAATEVRAALAGDDDQLKAYRRSNEVWGGAVSIAH
jgi:hypothetical protein